ncbi:hypothetical protein PWT90_08508 [Aphanocladium album]|nr:hypothetical protein PWT90_08508 [Aphanocladium album]
MQDDSEHRNSSESTASGTAASHLHGLPCRVEVRPAGAMGNGLFAVADIPRGTRILEETAIIASPVFSEEDHDLPAFCMELQRLSMAEKKTMDELFYKNSHITTELRGKAREWYRKHIRTDTDGSLLKGKRLQDVSKATVKRFAIFLTNRVQMGMEGAYGCGVFALYSRINHSCIPNAHNAYNASIGRLTVHAIRTIHAGEQITVTYIDGSCRTKKQRNSMLEKWGFVCSCEACTDPSQEVHRQRMHALDQRLAAYSSPMVRLMGRLFAEAAPNNAFEALQDAEELVNLLKGQGLEGMELCKAHVQHPPKPLRCSQF